MRAVGCLVGLAVGDALGAPLEGLPPPSVPVISMTGGGPHHRQAGAYTDDTLQALALSRSLIRCRGYNGPDTLQHLLAAYHRDPHSFGPTSRTVFELILHHTPPEEAAKRVHISQGSRTNGSVLRGIPLGIVYRAPVMIREFSRSCSQLTHLDPVAGECSAVVNILVSGLCRGMKKTTALQQALRWCESEEVAGMLTDYTETEPIPALDALGATHCAVRLFMETPSFEEGVVRAVNMGGDADTVGAICGAFAGAFWGVSSIPKQWVEALKDAPMIFETASRLNELLEP